MHVSQGTVANTDFGELIAPTLTALAGEDVTVVVTTGGPPVSGLGPLPGNALAAEFIPHDKLLPKTDVFVTNGGYGALHYAMASGTPVVVTALGPGFLEFVDAQRSNTDQSGSILPAGQSGVPAAQQVSHRERAVGPAGCRRR